MSPRDHWEDFLVATEAWEVSAAKVAGVVEHIHVRESTKGPQNKA